MTEKGPLTLDTTLTRTKFEELLEPEIQRTVEPTKKAIADANLTPEKIDKVLLVGGSTRIPAVQRLVKETIGRDPQRDLSPEEVVALGAAVQSLVLVEPMESGDVESTLATRYGKEKPVIIHMTPFSLGVGLQHDQFGAIIERNSTYPTEAKDIFTTTRDFQEAISFPIYEGEEPVASENTFLDMLRIEGVTPAPKGVPRIEVTFRLNSDRILEARGEDLATGTEKTIRIESTDIRLSDSEKNRMVSEAKSRTSQMLRGRIRETVEDEAHALVKRAETLAGSAGESDGDSARKAAQRLRELLDSGGTADEVRDGMDQVMQAISELESSI